MPIVDKVVYFNGQLGDFLDAYLAPFRIRRIHGCVIRTFLWTPKPHGKMKILYPKNEGNVGSHGWLYNFFKKKTIKQRTVELDFFFHAKLLDSKLLVSQARARNSWGFVFLEIGAIFCRKVAPLKHRFC